MNKFYPLIEVNFLHPPQHVVSLFAVSDSHSSPYLTLNRVIDLGGKAVLGEPSEVKSDDLHAQNLDAKDE
jgi:hypothetical protein